MSIPYFIGVGKIFKFSIFYKISILNMYFIVKYKIYRPTKKLTLTKVFLHTFLRQCLLKI